jgi:hypothetical protein
MPIRPENLSRYPADWKAISLRIRSERAGNRCEECGVENHAIGGRLADGTFMPAIGNPSLGEMAQCEGGETLRIIRIVLTVAHLDHQPENCADENLRALCQRCHIRHDAKMKAEGMTMTSISTSTASLSEPMKSL